MKLTSKAENTEDNKALFFFQVIDSERSQYVLANHFSKMKAFIHLKVIYFTSGSSILITN